MIGGIIFLVLGAFIAYVMSTHGGGGGGAHGGDKKDGKGGKH